MPPESQALRTSGIFKSGLKFSSSNGGFCMPIDDLERAANDADFRAARLHGKHPAYQVFDYRLSVEIARSRRLRESYDHYCLDARLGSCLSRDRSPSQPITPRLPMIPYLPPQTYHSR